MYQNEIQKHLLQNVKNQMRYDNRIKLGYAPKDNKGLEIVNVQGGGIRGSTSGKDHVKTDVSAGYTNTSSYGDNPHDFEAMQDKFESFNIFFITIAITAIIAVIIFIIMMVV